MERKHETDDVCDLGVTRNLVSGDAAGSRLPRSTATKHSLCPQSITLVFRGARKVRLQKGNGVFAAFDVCDTTNTINWGVCSQAACTAVLP